MDVSRVRWPEETSLLEELRALGRPRLLLVEDDAPPPRADADDLEDWIRLPADNVDVQARVARLRLRMQVHLERPPTIDDDGVTRLRDRWVSLPPVEARLAGALVDRFGSVVSRETLARAGWPAGVPGRNALDVHMVRLRRRLAPLGLAIRTVRSRGYLLERDAIDAGQVQA